MAILTGIRKEYLKKIENGEAYGIKISHMFTIAKVLCVHEYELCEGI